MDPKKSADDEGRAPEENTKPETNETNDVSLSEETNGQPGTIVVGDKPSPDETASGDVPPAPEPKDDMPPFMKDSTSTDVPPPGPAGGGKKVGLIIGIVLAVLLLVGGAAAYYFTYVVPNQPDNVLKSALANTFGKGKVQSVGFDGSASLTDKTSESEFTVDFSGAGDQSGQATFTGSIDAVVTNVTLDFRSVDGKTFYAKVGGLAGLPELLAQSGDETAAGYAPLLQAINDQWYEINESFLTQMSGSDEATTTGLSDADRRAIAEAYDEHSFLTVQENLGSEAINGVDSHHYKVVIDKTKLQGFIAAIEAANIESLGLTPEVLAGLKDSVSSADLSKYPVEVWIAKDTKLFTQFAVSAEDAETSFSFRLTLKDYNKPVSVEAPEGAKSILEVLNTYYEALGTGFTAEDLPISEGTNGISL